jgi:hypothetical protein
METIRVGDTVELPDGALAKVAQVLDTSEKGRFYKVRKVDGGAELVVDEGKVRLCSQRNLFNRLLDKFRK